MRPVNRVRAPLRRIKAAMTGSFQTNRLRAHDPKQKFGTARDRGKPGYPPRFDGPRNGYEECDEIGGNGNSQPTNTSCRMSIAIDLASGYRFVIERRHGRPPALRGTRSKR